MDTSVTIRADELALILSEPGSVTQTLLSYRLLFEQDRVFPSVTRLNRFTGMSRNTITSAIQTLKRLRLICEVPAFRREQIRLAILAGEREHSEAKARGEQFAVWMNHRLQALALTPDEILVAEDEYETLNCEADR